MGKRAAGGAPWARESPRSKAQGQSCKKTLGQASFSHERKLLALRARLQECAGLPRQYL